MNKKFVDARTRLESRSRLGSKFGKRTPSVVGGQRSKTISPPKKKKLPDFAQMLTIAEFLPGKA